eukprot:TRINITY_DN15797_c0_g1_i1.p1 TRINITY_DN15797_c0_g1~~TRINITY_DN15797_c0_g1_i1.p1  ORF type:complete len:410 (+),score=106.04 TRINITY_DN15797_c0_g1_i1:53-1231(+)
MRQTTNNNNNYYDTRRLKLMHLDLRFMIVATIGFMLGFFASITLLRSGYLLDFAGVERRSGIGINDNNYDNNNNINALIQANSHHNNDKSNQNDEGAEDANHLIASSTSTSTSTSTTSTSSASPPIYCKRNYKYLIASVQRSGTHYLAAMLKLNPMLEIGPEIFKGVYFEHWKERFHKPNATEWSDFSREEMATFLANYVYGIGDIPPSNNTNNEIKYFKRLRAFDGFIAHNKQMHGSKHLLPLLASTKHWKAIHLVRDNHFHSYVSFLVIESTHDRGCHVGQVCPADEVTVEVDIEDMLNYFRTRDRQIEDNRKMLKRNNIPYIEVNYQALVDGRQNFCDIWTWAECTCPEIVPISRVKSVRRKYSDIVRNYDTVVKAMNDSGYGHFLEGE